MKTIRTIGLASIASAALVAFSPMSFAETSAEQSATQSKLVHRVSHALAADQRYTGTTGGGYKWGKKTVSSGSKSIWTDSPQTRTGYKWGQTSTTVVDRPVSASYAEQSANRWRRRDFTEQSANRWSRRDFTEQSANRWRRRDFTEQSANRWRRRDFTEQSANRWSRRDFTEQSANRWRRR